MGPRRDPNKPKGAMSSYAFFVQICRDEHKKQHPQETVVFAEFSRKCSEKWRMITPAEKERFEKLAHKDKERYEGEMAGYIPPGGVHKKIKRKKDPNAPKRPLSAFFLFSKDERPGLKVDHPDWTVSEVAKDLGKKWETYPDKKKYELLASKDKIRYEQDMVCYRNGSWSNAKKCRIEEEEEEADEEEEEEESLTN